MSEGAIEGGPLGSSGAQHDDAALSAASCDGCGGTALIVVVVVDVVIVILGVAVGEAVVVEGSKCRVVLCRLGGSSRSLGPRRNGEGREESGSAYCGSGGGNGLDRCAHNRVNVVVVGPPKSLGNCCRSIGRATIGKMDCR